MRKIPISVCEGKQYVYIYNNMHAKVSIKLRHNLVTTFHALFAFFAINMKYENYKNYYINISNFYNLYDLAILLFFFY